MKKLTPKNIAVILLVVLILAGNWFISWANNASPATETALAALETDARVTVTNQSGLITFQPAGVEFADIEIGFVFYPGGRVDYRAYAPVLRLIAQEGYFVALAPMPLNLAFFNVNAADQVQEMFPQIGGWVVGGHSLGGVAASGFASDHADILGMVFWASYPANDALKQMDLKVISIYGTNDSLSTLEKIDASRALLPAHTQFVAIEGGNHAQFGDYGPQPGDNEATISSADQHAQIVAAVVQFLASLVK